MDRQCRQSPVVLSSLYVSMAKKKLYLTSERLFSGLLTLNLQCSSLEKHKIPSTRYVLHIGISFSSNISFFVKHMTCMHKN